jgi:uncharacterized protein YjbJ (UPF0337 family)
MANDRDMTRSGREDQIRGRAEELKGKVRGDIGDTVDSREQHLKGRGQELKGKARRKFGEAKESLGESLGNRESSRPGTDRSSDQRGSTDRNV